MVARYRILLTTFVCVLGACGDQSSGGGADGGGQADTVLAAVDAGAKDASSEFPHPGFGDISGACDVLDTELTAPEPGFFRSTIAFDRLYTDSDLMMLTLGGQEIIADGNAGGSSVLSEVFAYELLERCENAQLLKTETEIIYDTEGKITDFLAEVDSLKIGVSVTRAVAFPFEDPYPVEKAEELLSGKLADILLSSENVSAEDRWEKQILAVLAYAPGHADALQAAYANIDPAVQADTLVLVLVTNGADDFIYCNGLCQ